jgi:hypothetical protein
MADTEIVGPPHAVNVSDTGNAELIPGSVTDIDVTTGHVCSPSEGTSLDCTMKPTAGTPVGGRVSVDGAIEKTVSCPVSWTVVGSGAAVAPCTAPIRLTTGRPSREHAVLKVFTTSTGL